MFSDIVPVDVPFCFSDDRFSQGGALCPSDIAVSERIDCHPEPNVSQDTCLKRGCYYCEGTRMTSHSLNLPTFYELQHLAQVRLTVRHGASFPSNTVTLPRQLKTLTLACVSPCNASTLPPGSDPTSRRFISTSSFRRRIVSGLRLLAL